MKKLLTASALLFSAAAIHATGNNNTKALADKMNVAVYNTSDTVRKDTTRKDSMFLSAVADRLVKDTLPKDTTRKDTTALAYNK